MKIFSGELTLKMSKEHAVALMANPNATLAFEKALANTMGVDTDSVTVLTVSVDLVELKASWVQHVAFQFRLILFGLSSINASLVCSELF